MAVISKTDLENAKLDADDLALFISDTAGTVAPRTGGTYPNIRQLVADFDAVLAEQVVEEETATAQAVIATTQAGIATAQATAAAASALSITPFAAIATVTGTNRALVSYLRIGGVTDPTVTYYLEQFVVDNGGPSGARSAYGYITRVSDAVRVMTLGANGSRISAVGLSGVQTFTMLPFNGSGLSATIKVDMGNGTVTFTANGTATTALIDNDKAVIASALWKTDVVAQVTTSPDVTNLKAGQEFFLVEPAATSTLTRFKGGFLVGPAKTDRVFIRVLFRDVSGTARLSIILARDYGVTNTLGSGGTTGSGGTGTYPLSIGGTVPAGTTILLLTSIGALAATVVGSITAGVLTVTSVTSGTIVAGLAAVVDAAALAGGGAAIDPTGRTRVDSFDLVAVNNSGWSGTVFIDLKAGEVFGPSSNYLYAASGLHVDKLIASAGQLSLITSQITAAAATEASLNTGSFDSRVTGSVLRSIFRKVWLYWPIDRTNEFRISQIAFYGGGSGGTAGLLPYVQIYVTNHTTSTTILRWSGTLPSPAASTGTAKAELVAWLQANFKTICLTDELYSYNNRRMYAECDWSGLVNLAYGDTYFTTMATGGIHADRIFDAGLLNDYLDRHHYHKRIDIAADGTAFDNAINAERTGTGSIALGIGKTAHYHNRLRLRLAVGDHLSTNKEIPAFVEGEGMGRSVTRIVRNGTDASELLAAHRDTKLFNLTLVSDQNYEYPLHVDAVNAQAFDATTGIQNRQFSSLFRNIDFLMVGSNTSQGFGCGLSSGQRLDFIACSARHATSVLPGSSTTAAAWFFHNTGPTNGTPGIRAPALPGVVNMTSCISQDDSQEVVFLQTLEGGIPCILNLTDCDFSMIRHETVNAEVNVDRAVDRVAWEINGRYNGPFHFRDVEGAFVLSAPTGTTITGALAAIMFGTVDDLGRGDKWIKTGTTKSLGARLGDRTGNSAALVLNGSSWTPTTNLTAASNATIIAAVLAATGVQLTEVDLRLETIPAATPRRRMRNSTGSTIAKGVFVKRTARGVIALAQPGDRIFGWTPRAILNGTDGDIITTRRIWWELIGGATADGGDWGLAAGGVLSFGAATKFGSVIGGTVEIW